MRLTRCFVPEALSAGSIVTLPEETAAHLTRVLRLRAGAQLTVFDGRGGEYEARLLEGTLARTGGRVPVQIEVGEYRPADREARLPVTLLQCLARGERMDWIVQKATELGVATIVPVWSQYSVVQLEPAAAGRRLAHWRGVALGACEQCGRNRVPEILEPRDVQAACAASAAAKSPPLRLLLSPEARVSLPQALQSAELPKLPHATAIVLLVGPEGGLAESELAAAQAHGFVPCRLGPRILRAETAPLAALAAIGAVVGDFR